MARNETQKCIKCNEIKDLSKDFYVSYSPLHATGRVPVCKDCLREYDFHNMTEVCEVLRILDKPFKKDIYDTSLIKGKDNPLGKYLRMIVLNYKLETWKDSDGIVNEVKTITRMNTEILRKQKELEELDEKTKNAKKEEVAKIPEELIRKWGKGYPREMYDVLEDKFKLIEQSYPIRSSMHLESLKNYCLFQYRSEEAIRNNDPDTSQKWSRLAQEQAKQAKITPQQLTNSDLSQGLDSFSSLAVAVEKAVSIIPIMPQFIEKPKDKVDFTVFCYVNYERELKGLPRVEYSDIYEFYNKMVEDYVKSSPDNYSFLKETDDSLPFVERLYHYVFDIAIPKAKKENPYDPFYQNLEKWVEVVSYLRWFPDLFYDLITPKDKHGNPEGIRLDLDQRVLLRCMARFKRMYVVFPRGYAKCVSYDTMLFTKDGIREIGELFNYKKTENEEIITTHNFSMLNRYGELETSDKGIISGYKKTKKIKTEYGYEIETSTNHPLLIMNKDGNLVYKKAEKLEKGDYLPINRNNDVWGNNILLNIDMESYIEKLSNQARHQVLKSKSDTPKELTEELALILGYLVGDGTLTRDNIVLFTSKDEDMVENYRRFINSIGLELSVRENGIDYVVYGKYFREYLNQIGLKQVDAFGKEVPKCILSAPKNIVSSFIRGLFDTDGCVDNGYLTFCTASEKLSKQVQTILLNFGIVSKREKTFNKKYKTNAYRIFIYGNNVDKYKCSIGFSCERKQNKLTTICDVKRNTNKDIIPYQLDNIIKYYNKAKIHNNYKFGDELYHVKKGNNDLTYDKLNKVINNYNIVECYEYNTLKELYKLNYFYTPIVDIEDDENYVCDIQMPETHSFIGNGFINHNTFLQTLSCCHTSIFYPNIEISLSAQTKQNASALIKDKYGEIMKFYPMLQNETIEKKNRFADNLSEVYWKSGSKMDTLANAQSSKGQRRKRGVIEESALLDNKTFEDAIEPIFNVPRRSIGSLGCVVPYELNGQINFFTTSYFKGTTEYARNVSMSEEMLTLNGTLILGSDFELACSYGRGEPRSVILDKKEKLTPTMFAVNYLSRWVGASDGALIAINKVMDLRVTTKADLKWDGKHEYIISCDVARSEHKENNQSSVVVLKLIKNKKGKLINVICVNIINYPSTVNFQTLAISLMKLKTLYNAKAVCIDANGLGVGLVDELLKEQFDPETKESLGCWNTMNTEQEPEIDYAEECLYALKSQQINHDIIVSFTNYIESGKLQLLEKRQDAGYDINDDDYIRTEVLPFAQTDLLLEEIANLKLVMTERNNKLTVERISRKIDKDRYSALAYGLYYIKLYEENDFIIESDEDASDYCLIN